jgi:regulator of protease activity HflC (stomatin/prohibitin superfamily)
MIREVERKATAGIPMLLLLLGALALLLWLLIASARANMPAGAILAVLLFVTGIILLPGFFVVNPNEGKALTIFGRYAGTVKQPGLWWTNPFMSKRRISLRVRNFETAKLKVNDKNSNPIEIAAIVVWKVVDTAEALFEVDDYQNYVHVQSESALRALATAYPYDAHAEGEISLSAHQAEVSAGLLKEIQERLGKAGVLVTETRISHLAYAPEIAAAMLQRQQASAIIAARQKIVEGAVGMVEMALDLLSKKSIVHLDEERKAAMVSNLMVVLCSERGTQPVLNTGSLYS